MQTCKSVFAEKKRKKFVLHPNADQINENIAMSRILGEKIHKIIGLVLFLEDQQMKWEEKTHQHSLTFECALTEDLHLI